MYLGQIVEHGDTAAVTSAPAHPYTKALLALAPDPEHSSRLERRRLLVPGEIPSADAPPAGCRFHPRCAYSQEICRQVAPALAPAEGTLGSRHVAACHFSSEIQRGVLPDGSATAINDGPERKGAAGYGHDDPRGTAQRRTALE
jgi:oligopeptide/dipeptide ABC transporter ATP-binding protein